MGVLWWVLALTHARCARGHVVRRLIKYSKDTRYSEVSVASPRCWLLWYLTVWLPDCLHTHRTACPHTTG